MNIMTDFGWLRVEFGVLHTIEDILKTTPYGRVIQPDLAGCCVFATFYR